MSGYRDDSPHGGLIPTHELRRRNAEVAYEEKITRLRAEVERLRAALKWLADKYDEAMPLRTADFHIPDCTCMRCARDNARAALEEKK